MSAGVFTRTQYQLRNGSIARIRVQPETLSATFDTTANAAPAGAPTAGLPTVYARKPERVYGIGARTVTLFFTGTLPDGYSGDPLTIPVLQSAVFDGIAEGGPATYLGAPAQVLSKRAENIT